MRYVYLSVYSSMILLSLQTDGMGGPKFAGNSTIAPKAAKKVAGQRTNASVARKNSKFVGNTTQIVRELESVRSLLNKADHDYKGHRAAAVHQVTHAIHLLQHGKHHPNPGNHFTPARNTLREPQKQSDAQLQQALAQLKTIASQLHSTQHSKHHTQAALAVKKAIRDLMLALKVA